MWIAYALAAVVIVAGIALRGWLSRRHEERLYLAHIEIAYSRWNPAREAASLRSVQAAYRQRLEGEGRPGDLDRWGEKATRTLGIEPRKWEAPDG
jgi:hypothetical protein